MPPHRMSMYFLKSFIFRPDQPPNKVCYVVLNRGIAGYQGFRSVLYHFRETQKHRRRSDRLKDGDGGMEDNTYAFIIVKSANFNDSLASTLTLDASSICY